MYRLYSLALLALASLISAAPLAPRADCPRYIVIEAPGLGDQVGWWTAPLTYEIMKGLAGGERYNLKTVPPSDSGPNSSAMNLLVNSTLGAAEIVSTVATRFAECPSVKFVITGYSYGSIEVVEAMNNPALLRVPVAAVILNGNCFWHAGRPENRGTATSGTSVCGGTVGLGTPPQFEGITADFCNENDYLCTGTPYDAPVNNHWSYRNSVWQTEAAQFAVSQLQKSFLETLV